MTTSQKMSPEQNYQLLMNIDAHRRFILQACCDNPDLMKKAEPRVRQWLQGEHVEGLDSQNEDR